MHRVQCTLCTVHCSAGTGPPHPHTSIFPGAPEAGTEQIYITNWTVYNTKRGDLKNTTNWTVPNTTKCTVHNITNCTVHNTPSCAVHISTNWTVQHALNCN